MLPSDFFQRNIVLSFPGGRRRYSPAQARRGVDGLSGKVTLSTKQQSALLMVASIMSASAQSGELDHAQEAPEPPEGQAELTFQELLPDALRQLKADFEADRQEAATAWRTHRLSAERHLPEV
jgi:hypothetical protein